MAIDLGGAVGLVTGGATAAAPRHRRREQADNEAAVTAFGGLDGTSSTPECPPPASGQAARAEVVSYACPGRTLESTFSQARGVYGNALRSRCSCMTVATCCERSQCQQ